MENIMNTPVDVICYGQREHFETRQEAIDKYVEGMAACEGSERDRYFDIYYALVNSSADLVTDGTTERTESEPLVKFTANDKDKIINFIIADVLSINSSEIYDRGEGKLVVEDRDIIKALLKKEGWYAAQFLRKYIENDKELLIEASRGGVGDRGALVYASNELCDDKTFVLEMLKYDASDVRYVSYKLSNDPEIISVALKCAETDYDLNNIKEALGGELLAEMVQAHLDKHQEKISEKEVAANVVLEGQKNSLAEKIAEAESVKVSEGKENSKLFDVTITETLKMTVQVEAESLLEAEQMVSDNWHNQDYILDADHFKGVDFEAKAVKEKKRGFDDRDER